MTSKEPSPVIYFIGSWMLALVGIISVIGFLGNIIIKWNGKIVLVMHSDNIFLIPLIASILGMAFIFRIVWKDKGPVVQHG